MNSYKVGRALGKLVDSAWWAFPLTACAVGIWALSANQAKTEENARILAEQQAVEHAAASAAEARASEAMYQRCVVGAEVLLASASERLKAGDPEGAERELKTCEGHLSASVTDALQKRIDQAVAKREAAEQEAAARAERLAAAQEKAQKKRAGVRIGMSKQDVIDSSWGRPTSVNRTTTAYGTHEQWVYGGGNYLYFEDGKLTSIQN